MSAIYETGNFLSGTRHGFFGRAGGTSTGDFAGNNVSLTTGDDPAVAMTNRDGIAGTMGYNAEDLVILRQTHSTIVHGVTDRLAGDAVVEADAMVTDQAGLLLGIMTADCTPVLFADVQARVVGAAHAGWCGAVEGICEGTIDRMVALGARRERIAAAIGPTISGPNYEVGPQFAADLLNINPLARAHIACLPGGVEHFDLPGFVADRLAAAGIGTIERVGGCTYADPSRYFSHRYATHHKTRTGRQLAVIGLA